MRVEVAVDEPCTLGESACWDEAERVLWWIDIRAPAIHRWSPSTGARRSWIMPALIGSIVPRARGGFFAGLQTGFQFFDPASGALTPIANPEPNLPKNRPNDAKCDRAGRLWCGTMEDYGANRRGTLYRLDPDLSLHPVDGPFFVPNAIAFTADGKRMSFTDTGTGDVLAFEYDPATGTRGARSVWLAADAAPGRPDGACIDAEGCLWNARYRGGAVVRVTPAGKVDRIVEVPTIQPTSCCFGGALLDELYVTTAAQRLTPEERAAQPHAGAVFVIRPGVTGVPDTPFAG